MPPFTSLLIDGKQLPSSNGETFDVRNPYSGEVVGTSASATKADCNAAIESANKAFQSWERSSITYRRDIFLKAAEILASKEYKSQIAAAMQEETSAVDYWCMQNWISGINYLRDLSSMAAKELRGEIFESGSIPGAQVMVQRRALGVVLAIAPWNAPLTLSVRAVAIPLLCGNTVILKSSEFSPRSQSFVVKVFNEAGLPPGVLNFISMSKDASASLVSEIIAHPLVRHFNFTGSDRVGKLLAMEAAKHLKTCVLELGGKAPSIVLNDANIKEATRAITFGAMAHSGQVCMSTERVIVQRGVAEELISNVKNLCETLKVGDPFEDPSIRLGPLFSEALAENVLNMIQEACDAGAELLLGNLTRERSLLKPHLLKSVRPGMRLWDQESFGPVVSFTEVDTVEEAIKAANATEYSLAASLWTENASNAQTVATQIRSCLVNVNGPTIHSEPSAGIFGLGGLSGYGGFNFNQYTQNRTVVTHKPDRMYPLFN